MLAVAEHFRFENVIRLRQREVLLRVPCWLAASDIAQDFHAIDHPTEDGVFAIQVAGWNEGQKKLGVPAIRLVRQMPMLSEPRKWWRAFGKEHSLRMV